MVIKASIEIELGDDTVRDVTKAIERQGPGQVHNIRGLLVSFDPATEWEIRARYYKNVVDFIRKHNV